jgi:hypothetical protein
MGEQSGQGSVLQGTNESSPIELLSSLMSEVGSTKVMLVTLRDWLSRSGFFRCLWDAFDLVSSWKRLDVTILCILCCFVCGFVLERPEMTILVVGLGAIPYFILLVKVNIVSLPGPPLDDIQANLAFNQRIMQTWSRFHDQVQSLPTDFPWWWLAFLFVPCYLLFSFLSVAQVSIACFLLYLFSRLQQKHSQLYSRLQVTATPESEGGHYFEVFENQRWWFGHWSYLNLSVKGPEIYPWSDKTGRISISKSHIELPGMDFHWESLWHVDKRGWTYATNFSQDVNSYHETQTLTDFVRRRRWVRTYSRR